MSYDAERHDNHEVKKIQLEEISIDEFVQSHFFFIRYKIQPPCVGFKEHLFSTMHRQST